MEKGIETELMRLRPGIIRLAKSFRKAVPIDTSPEDIAQEVLLKLWLAMKDGEEIKNKEAWAATVTKNICVSLYRKQKSHGSRSLDGMDAGTGSEGTGATELEILIQKTMDSIPKGTRMLLRMKASGMSLDGIAAATGRPKTSIKSSISAAKKTIEEKLGKEDLI